MNPAKQLFFKNPFKISWFTFQGAIRISNRNFVDSPHQGFKGKEFLSDSKISTKNQFLLFLVSTRSDPIIQDFE